MRITRFFVGLLFIGSLVGISFFGFTYGGSPPASFTNAPGENNCTYCHSGTLITSGANWNNFTISSNIPSNGYSPGVSYTIQISHVQAGINKWGFQTVVLNNLNAQAGNIVAGIGNQTQFVGNRLYVNQTIDGNQGSGSKNWSFTWIAPPVNTGTITIYTTLNAANGNSGSGGDQIYAKTLSVPEAINVPTAAISGATNNQQFCVGDTIYLSGGGLNNPTGFTWQFTDLAQSTLQNPRIVFLSPGIKLISLSTSNNNGISMPTNIQVTINPKPNATITPTGAKSICGTDSVLLSGVNQVGAIYLWTPDNRNTSSIKTVTAGNHQLKVTFTNTGCFAVSNPVTLTSRIKPTANLMVPSGVVCEDDSVVLSAAPLGLHYDFYNIIKVLNPM